MVKISLEDKVQYLAIGELALGTKAYDPRAMDGLALFLELNDYKINNVILDSGLVPLIPEYYGINNAKAMRFLGNDPDKEPNKRAQLALKSDIEKKDKEYIEKYVLKKIVTKHEAVDFAKKELKKLTDILGNIRIDYVHGEEDKRNIIALEELKINDYKRLAQNQHDLEEKILTYKKNLENLKKEESDIREEKTILQYSRKYLRHKENIKQDKKYTLKEYITVLIERKHEEFSKLEPKDAEELKLFLKKIKTTDDIQNKLKQIYKDQNRANAEIKHLKKDIRECEISLNALEREKEASGFFRITKRQHIKPDEEELLYRLAKKEYNDLLYNIVDSNNFHIHTDGEVNLNIGKLKFTIYHSPNIASNKPSNKSLKKLIQQTNHDNKLGKKPADIKITAHGANGFRFIPTSKYTENTVQGEQRQTPEISMNIKLPTFQSPENLEYLKKKNVSNWHVKRYDAKNYASGAVIHTINKDKLQSIEYIDHKDLVKFGEISYKIKQLKQKLSNQDDDSSKKLTKKQRQRLQQKINNEIKDLESLVKLQTKKIEVLGDVHIGCPNTPGRPSNYQVLEKCQEYQKKNGLPDVIVASEILHGTIDKTFGSNKQYLAHEPAKVQELEDKIMNSNQSDKEKLRELKELRRQTQEAIPITSNSVAKIETKRRIIPYLENILDLGGSVILVSGNHYNGSTGDDEAYELASMLPLKYIDNGQIKIFHGLGQRYGCGTTRLDENNTLFSAHKPKKGSDVVAGAMNQMLSANKDADIVIFFDKHHAGGGYADNSTYVAAAPMQPYSSYADMIGAVPSLRGIINLYYDSDKQYRKWDLVLDPVLEYNKNKNKKGGKK